jgi:hypothetical protein
LGLHGRPKGITDRGGRAVVQSCSRAVVRADAGVAYGLMVGTQARHQAASQRPKWVVGCVRARVQCRSLRYPWDAEPERVPVLALRIPLAQYDAAHRPFQPASARAVPRCRSRVAGAR